MGDTTRRTDFVADSAKGRITEDIERVGCRNAHRSFSLVRSSKYYEGRTYLHTYFVLSMLSGPVIGFGLRATERPGEPITRATFEKCIIYDGHAEALLALFERLLGESADELDHR